MITFRILDFLSPKIPLWWLRLRRSQYYSEKKMQALEWRLLARILDQCFENSPYYRKRFVEWGLHRADFQSLDDLVKIPILTKEELREHMSMFRTADYERYRPCKQVTTGTTGKPLTVYWDLDSNILEFVCMWRSFSWSGYKIGQPFLDLRSRVMNAPKGYLWNWKCRGLEMSSDHMTPQDVEMIAGVLERYRIKLWRGHPAAICHMLHLFETKGRSYRKPKCICVSSEALLPRQRDYIESQTGVPVCDHYGLTEHNAFISQCPQGGYHIAREYGIIEILREDGTPAAPGEEGRIVATGLHNKAFPLLRYETGDYAVQSDKRCSCGRTLPLVESLTGRISDRLLTTDGRWVSGLQFVLDSVRNIRTAQLVQREEGTLDVYFVPTPSYTRDCEASVISDLKEKLGRDMEIHIHLVERVPFSATGKFKMVVSKLDRAGLVE